MYKDFREYLGLLEKNNLLYRVKKEVDASWEISSVIRTVITDVTEDNRYGIIFENVKGASFPAAIGCVGTSRRIAEIAWGDKYEKRHQKGTHALMNPIEPKLVETGPCKENILKGDQIDLGKIPFVTWSPGLDNGAFHTSGTCFTKDHNTGKRNVAIYRMNFKGKDFITLNIGRPRQHGGMNFKSWEAAGKSMPVVIAIGVDPVISMVAVGGFAYGFDELTLASALKGEPIPVVNCETIDMQAPANAEIVIEGEVTPGDTAIEGNWGEAAGYMTGEENPKPVLRVKAITHRNRAIYQAFLASKPPNEASYITAPLHESFHYKHLTVDSHIPGILDLCFTKPSTFLHLVVKMKPMYTGHVKQVLMSCAGFETAGCKFVTAVDEDIDIHNLEEVEWAHMYRVQPDRDVVIIGNTTGAHQDLSTSENNWRRAPGSKMLIDATKKWEYPPTALPPEEHLEKVKSQWESYGLPPLSYVKEEKVAPVIPSS